MEHIDCSELLYASTAIFYIPTTIEVISVNIQILIGNGATTLKNGFKTFGFLQVHLKSRKYGNLE